MQEFITLANHLADEAGTIVHQYFRRPLDVSIKEDDSPVTIADRAIEKRLRAVIESARPEDGIYGEEFSIKESRNAYTWVIDPIDGTKSFMIGRPTFGTLIALCKNDVPILGIIDQPILKERWVGAQGKPTTLNGRPVTTRPCKSLKQARICSTTPAMFKQTGPVYEAFETGCKIVWGGDCYAYGLLAAGHVDIIIEASLSPYDFCALVPVVEGAGGRMCDWQGRDLSMKSEGRVLALGDSLLWKPVSQKINAPRV